MTDLSAMLHLTKDEEQRLLSIAKERKKKKILDRIVSDYEIQLLNDANDYKSKKEF